MDDDAAGIGRFCELLGRWQQAGDAGTERVQPLTGRRGDRERVDALGCPRSLERRPGLERRRQVELVERDEHRLLEQRRIVRPQLLADDVIVPGGVPGGTVDDMDEDPRSFDVAQERVAQAGPGAGPLDEAGHVRDRRASLVLDPQVHDARGSVRAW